MCCYISVSEIINKQPGKNAVIIIYIFVADRWVSFIPYL